MVFLPLLFKIFYFSDLKAAFPNENNTTDWEKSQA